MDPFVSVRGLSLAYQNTPILTSLSFSLEEHGFLQLSGASGAGKSSLLNLLAGLHPRYSGEVLINGLPPGSKQLRVAYVL